MAISLTSIGWMGFRAESKLLVIFHGLEGCSRSHYAVSLMNQLRGEGWCGVVPHFRGCGGEINRLQSILSRGGFCRGRLDLTPAQGEASRSSSTRWAFRSVAICF